MRAVGAADVVEFVFLRGERLDGGEGAVVQNPDFVVGVAELEDVLVGVFEDL
jgi:hypothetical protein